ncbi:hypothetical protein Tco_1571143 [Tanacetum coccineum]
MKLRDCLLNHQNGVIRWENLEILHLWKVRLDEDTIENNLEILHLWIVRLDEDMIENIFSGTPCLNDLEFEECYGFVNDKVAAGGYRQVKVLEFFDCPGPRQGVEDLKELLHKGAQGDREAEVFQVYTTMYEEWGLQTFGCCRDIAAEWAEDTTMSTYLVNRSSSSAIGFKTPVDMLRFFGWLASIKQGMLEPVKVKCIFLGYRKVHDREQHSAWELFSYREDSNEAAFVVAALDMIYAHESLTFNNIVACEVISKWEAGLKDDMDASSDVYVLSNGCKKCSDDSDDYYWEYTRGMFIHKVEPQEDHTFEVEPHGNVDYFSRIHNEKLVQTLLKGHSMLSLKDSLSGDCDVEKNGSLKVNLQHMMALSTTEVGYMTFTLANLQLKIVADIGTGSLSKAIPGPRFQHRLNLMSIVFVWNFMSRRTIIESEIEMITEEVEDDSAIIYDKDTSIVDVWPDIRKKNRLFRGPTHAGSAGYDAIDMIEKIEML